MSVTIEVIKFNHDPVSSANGALNIRKNKNTFINVPEWERGKTIVAEDSLAAYEIAGTKGKTIYIHAQFKGPPNSQAQIRALDAQIVPPEEEPGQGGCMDIIVKGLQALFRLAKGNVLGEIKEKWIQFDNAGLSGFIPLPLYKPILWNVGVGIHYTEWQWQYKIEGNTWSNMSLSKHKIYVLLERPKAPWKQTPYNASNDQLPWTEVMDYACSWALLAKDPKKAASRITQEVFDLGTSIITYDCPGWGASHYSYDNISNIYKFYCTEFLDLLKGGLGRGKYVNCSDCATIVSTFANILGCDLAQSQMGHSFELNEMLAIGSSTWQTPCNWKTFNYHEVAWSGSCDVNDKVYDACLKVDGDNDPTTSPHTALLPVDLTFGNVGTLLYRDRLATPVGRPKCKPLKNCMHRKVV